MFTIYWKETVVCGRHFQVNNALGLQQSEGTQRPLKTGFLPSWEDFGHFLLVQLDIAFQKEAENDPINLKEAEKRKTSV